MHYQELHSWKVTPQEARLLQNELHTQVIREDQFDTVNTVAGVDIGLQENIVLASVVVLSFPELKVVDGVVTTSRVEFPYIPGFLSFREMPPLLVAFSRLTTEPDIVIVDGQGIAHPRRFGLASHLGLVLNKPTIGCAKSRLCGSYTEPDMEKGSFTYLMDKTEIIGAALRTRTNVSPVFISLGHRISLDSALKFILDCCPKYRLPETTRFAHKAASGNIPDGVKFVRDVASLNSEPERP